MEWKTTEPNIGDSGLMVVCLSSGKKDMLLALIGEHGDLVDVEYGDDLGWDSGCVDRWVTFEEIEKEAFGRILPRKEG